MAWLKEYASIYTIFRIQLSQGVKKIASTGHDISSIIPKSICDSWRTLRSASAFHASQIIIVMIIILIIKSSLLAPTYVSSTNINSNFILLCGLIKQVMKFCHIKCHNEKRQRHNNNTDFWLTVQQLDWVLVSASGL